MKTTANVLTALLAATLLAGCPFCPECPTCENEGDEGSVVDELADKAITKVPSRAVDTPAADEFGDLIDEIHKGKSNWRTWSIYEGDPGGLDHVKKGHAFRIERKANQIQFVPLTDLRDAWEWPEDHEPVILNKVHLSGDIFYYCADFDVPHNENADNQETQRHGLRIKLGNKPNEVDLDFFEISATVEGTPDPSFDVQCKTVDLHGGEAHAEN